MGKYTLLSHTLNRSTQRYKVWCFELKTVDTGKFGTAPKLLGNCVGMRFDIKKLQTYYHISSNF